MTDAKEPCPYWGLADHSRCHHCNPQIRVTPSDVVLTDDELEELIKPIWLAVKPSREAQQIRSSISVEFDSPKTKDWASSQIPDYVWDLVDIAAQRGMAAARNPCDKIFSHKWLSMDCVDRGCQAPAAQRAKPAASDLSDYHQALEIMKPFDGYKLDSNDISQDTPWCCLAEEIAAALATRSERERERAVKIADEVGTTRAADRVTASYIAAAIRNPKGEQTGE